MGVERRLSLPLLRTHLRDVQVMVDEALEGADEELKNASVMVASELSENVVKYGEPLPGHESYVEVRYEPSEVVIVAANGVVDATRVQNLAGVLERIDQAADPRDPYVERMRDILASPEKSGSQLGLLRIAYEGRFRLSYAYRDRLLTITAYRGIG